MHSRSDVPPVDLNTTCPQCGAEHVVGANHVARIGIEAARRRLCSPCWQERLGSRVVFADRWLVCVDCRQEWLSESSEQQWLAERGMAQTRRCRTCRAIKRAERERAYVRAEDLPDYRPGGTR